MPDKQGQSTPEHATAATLAMGTGNRDTIPDSGMGSQDTYIAEEAHHPAAATAAPRSDAAPETGGSLPQTTVLPRMEFDGQVPRFVQDPKSRYVMGSTLGEGGIGQVLGAHDNDIERKVALKRIRAEVQSPVAMARFVEEIRTTGRLEHPNIVPIHDVGVDEDGNYYFIMKYVDGEDLESIIRKLREGDPDYHQRYSYGRRVEIFKGVLEAVAYAHSQGFIHRDIKPANVMVGPFGEVLLMDWGIAKRIRQAEDGVDHALLGETEAPQTAEEGRKFQTQVGQLIGTPAYMAPEQARGEPADERSDVFALSVMFHEFLTLRHYLSDKKTLAETLAGVVDEKVPAAAFAKSPHQPAVGADLSWFVEGGVKKDPAERYPSVDAMIDRLDRRADGHIPVQCPMTAMRAATNASMRFMDNHPFFVLFTVILLGVSALGGIVYGITRLV